MKKYYSILAVVLLATSMLLPQLVRAQAPEKMSYQAVIRNSGDLLVMNTQIGMQISILQGSANGTIVYTETQNPSTNANGLVSIEIGSGADFSTIDWANDIYFIKTETDPSGGTNYTISGTSQLMSVPYALYAKTSGSSIPGPQGSAGNDGAVGATGLQGPQGPMGNEGATGPQGSQGPTGNDGADGATGSQGTQGPAGNDGPIGATGLQGPQGATGNEGATGPQGPQGTTGNVGATGATGAQGTQGMAGNDGADGTQGPAGNDGTAGTIGPQGPQGPAGNGASKIDDLSDGKSDSDGSDDGSSLFIGIDAGLNDDSSDNENVGIGYQALYSNERGIKNTVIGYQAFYSNNGGGFNVANGYQALYNNFSGFHNVATGYQSLFNNTTGLNNTAYGSWALYSNLTGNNNTAYGHQALFSNTIGIGNVATGREALRSNTEGNENTAIGYQALWSNIEGDGNTANGYRALYSNTIASNNTANGYRALVSNTEGHSNTANGYQALVSNTEGRFNTANGSSALSNNTDGNGNVAFGSLALGSNTTGIANTAIGHSASFTGSANNNSSALGYLAVAGASNTIMLGNSDVSTIGGFANWSNVSDGRFKVDVQENVAGLEFIKKLRPVTYHLDMDALAAFNNTPDNLRLPESEKLKAAELQVGFIAQEVEAAAKELNFDFHGVDVPKNETSHYGLRYAEFVPPVVKAIQELANRNDQLDDLVGGQQELIEAQRVENADLRSQLQSIMSALHSAGIAIN